jgi:hypothetical protein
MIRLMCCIPVLEQAAVIEWYDESTQQLLKTLQREALSEVAKVAK